MALEAVTGILINLVSDSISQKRIKLKEGKTVNDIKYSIGSFDRRFENTELDTGAFQRYIESSNVVRKIYRRIFGAYAGDPVPVEDFKAETARYAFDEVNRYCEENGWDKIRDVNIFHEYFSDLIDRLISMRNDLLSLEASVQTSIIADEIHRAKEELQSSMTRLMEHNLDSENSVSCFIITENTDITPSEHFTGREVELQRLLKYVSEGKKVLVCGIGGIGKTHLCRSLFRKYVDSHLKGEYIDIDCIGYLNYMGSMDDTLVKGLVYTRTNDYDLDTRIAWKRLADIASSKRALIIIDNVSKTSGQDQSLKKLYGLTCSVIITSRYNYMERFDAFRINHLSLEECKRVFSSIYGSSSPGEQADLEYILGKLAALHTKTVGLLAFMSGNKGWTISGLKKKLDEKKFDLSYIVDGRKTTLQTEYEKLFDLAGLTESEINILESFSLFPPLPLSIDICSRWMNKDANAGEDDELFNTLYQKGWLERDGNLFFMHPVVAEVIYAKQKPEISRHTKLLEACAESIRINETEVFTRVLPYMPFAEAAVQEMYDEGSHIIAVLADLIGCIYCKSGDYVKAQDWLEKGLNINEKVFGIDHLNTTGSLNNLAGLYCIMGRYKEAELLFRRALQIRSETLGEVHSDTALCLNKLAELYHSLGRYEEAELLYTRALSIVQTIFGEKHMYAAIVLNNQAGLYRSLGRYEEAESLYKRSLSIREEILGGMHPSMAACLNDLAGLYKYNGRYKEAEFLYKRALAICKEALGEKHPDTAKCLNNLALLYPIHGKYEEAESLYKQAIVVCEEILGERHPDTAVCLKNLAMLYESQGRYEEAESMYKKSLSIREELFGQRHLLTASCLDDLAGFYESHGKYEKAESLYKRALSIYKEVLGEEHPTAVKIMNNLEELYKLRT